MILIKHIKGNIFNSDADVILHQVNCQGKMGSGVAKQVRDKYPWVYAEYRKLCEYAKNHGEPKSLLGINKVVYINENQQIANLFAQEHYGYDGQLYTSYDALRKCLKSINHQFKGKKVAIPYLMGCHRGGGDWKVVSKMIEENLSDCDVTLYQFDGK